MSAHTLRQRAGALIYDWPRLLRSVMTGRRGWVGFRNRNERLTIDPATGGARCEWQYGRDLHLCKISPLASRVLLRRALREWPIVMGAQHATVGEPRVSFIIGHRGEPRMPQLLATLQSIAGQRGVPVECIVVEQSERAMLPPHLPAWVRYVHTPIGSDATPYNRSWAFNVGVAHARSSLLILHDNDLLVPTDYSKSVVTLHEQGWEIIDVKRFIFYFSQDATHEVCRSGNVPLSSAARTVTENNLGGGSVAVDRSAYSEIGGFDESYGDWGGEDNEFWQRAETRRTYAFGYVPLVHLFHAPQAGRTAADASEGVRRFHRDTNTSPQERIARLRARPNGNLEGPFRD
jgi:hypothetical protein